MRRCSWAALVAALATLAASLVGSAPPGPDAALIAVAGELALEFPQNASVFASDERPRLVVGSRPGVEWDARLRLAYRIWGMHGGDVGDTISQSNRALHLQYISHGNVGKIENFVCNRII